MSETPIFDQLTVELGDPLSDVDVEVSAVREEVA